MKKARQRTWIFITWLAYVSVHAQLGGPPPSTQLPKAQPVPLSGRQQTGSVVPMQTTTPGGGTNSVDIVNPSIKVQGSYQGSVPTGKVSDQPVALTLQDAVRRGIQYNLGAISSGNASRQARAAKLAAIAQLLPDITGSIRETVEQQNLAAEGLRIQIPVPGFRFPSVVTFNNLDGRANFSESLSITALRNWKASRENARAAELSVQDSRDLVALAVAGSYLQLIATAARMQTASAQIGTAKAIYQQAFDKNRNGLAAHIDVSRSLVEQQTQEERLTSLTNDFEKQKIALARLIGLPLAQAFSLADTVPRPELPAPDPNELIQRAFTRRSDVLAAAAQLKAAQQARRAATAEYYPSFELLADYGAIGVTPTSDAHGTFSVVGAMQFPIFRSGRIRSDIEQGEAVLNQRKAEYEDAKGQAEQDVRTTILDLATALKQVKVAESNRALASDTLTQARDRFRAGVADTVELVQAQESVATSEQDYISALFSLSLAQISLARAVGETEQGIAHLLQGK